MLLKYVAYVLSYVFLSLVCVCVCVIICITILKCPVRYQQQMFNNYYSGGPNIKGIGDLASKGIGILTGVALKVVCSGKSPMHIIA